MSDEEEDWFERALRELDDDPEDPEETKPDGSEEGGPDDPEPDDPEPDDPERGVGSAVGDDGEEGSHRTDDPTISGEGPVPDPDEDPFGGVRGSSGASDGDARNANVGMDANDVRDGIETATANDATPKGAGDPHRSKGGGDPGGRDAPVDGDAGGDPFGGDGFGFADFDGPKDEAGTSFDPSEAEFDSDIERIDIGIEGLDEMILGGVPSRSLMSVIGSAGTGKTTFALQFLHEGLEADEKAVYLTLEQSRESIHDTAEEKGWPFREYSADDQLAIVAMDPIEMANSLTSIRNDFARLIADFGAERLVLDSVSLLEMMYERPAHRRSEVFDFTRSLKESGVTTLLTSEASEGNPYASRYGIVEYLTDAVFVLQYVRGSDFRETRLAVEIQKIRDANHSRETKPYAIGNDGISVYRQANIF